MDETALSDGAAGRHDWPVAMGPAPWGPLTITEEISPCRLCDTQFAALVLAHGIPHTAEWNWATRSGSLDGVLPYALTTARSARERSALLDLTPLVGARSFAVVVVHGEMLTARIAVVEQALIGEIERWLRERFPVEEPTESHEVPVRFWSCGAHGAASVARTIAVPDWGEVQGNYPTRVQGRLERLLGPAFRPAKGGQLILWHGQPGTGKTFALRALAWEWRQWCELHYVVDPEVFFGQRADYMLDVILDVPYGEDEGSPRWRLLVLEDTGELLAADAKERTGQGLSRLLNLVDGIVGQGLRVLVLVTTNEALGRLHPAVARPGRCAARIEFELFPAAEAGAWLAEQGVEPSTPSGRKTLASLFAEIKGYETEPARSVGFAS